MVREVLEVSWGGEREEWGGERLGWTGHQYLWPNDTSVGFLSRKELAGGGL